MRIGYARADLSEQNLHFQLARLEEARCEHVVVERASTFDASPTELLRVLTHVLYRGDTLVVCQLDRLAGSPRQLIKTLDHMNERGILLESLGTQGEERAFKQSLRATFEENGSVKYH